jgi:hypothetical protein
VGFLCCWLVTHKVESGGGPPVTGVGLVLVDLRQGSGVLLDTGEAILRSRLVPTLAETAD